MGLSHDKPDPDLERHLMRLTCRLRAQLKFLVDQ